MTVIVEVEQEDIRKAKEYTIAKYKYSYKRLSESEKEVQFRHLFFGKLGEIIGKRAIDTLNIPNNCENMLLVVKEQNYKDDADIILFPEKFPLKGDFKTAWMVSDEKTCLLVPKDQYENQIKDLYIGVKIYPSKWYEAPFIPDIKREAKVFGWVLRGDLRNPRDCPVPNLRINNYWFYFKDLNPLEELFELVFKKETMIGKKINLLDFIT